VALALKLAVLHARLWQLDATFDWASELSAGTAVPAGTRV
jgi:hypothetical protein